MGQEKSKIVLIASGIYLTTLVLGIIILGNSFGVNGIASSLVISATFESIYLFSIDKFINLKTNNSNKNDEN